MPGQSEGRRTWTNYLANLGVSNPTSLWHDAPNPLFDQAALSFDAKAFAATSVLCRAACEAACYLFLTRTVQGLSRGTARVYMPKTSKGLDATTRFEDLIDKMCERSVLTESQCQNIRRIKEHGDVVAHLAERHTKALTRPAAHMDDLLWITEGHARDDLRDTADILATIASVIEQHPERMGPSPADRPNRT